MRKRPLIVCAGYMPLDIIHTPAGTVARSAGGTAANVAAILAWLGWDAVLAGQAGEDLAGEELVADLEGAGVDTKHVHRSSSTLTPRLVHDVRSDGHFFSYLCPDCDSRFPRSRPLTLDQAARCADELPRPTVFFFDRVNAATLWLAEHYAANGSLIVFEPSVPAHAALLARAAKAAHMVKHSDDRSVGGLDDLDVEPREGQVRVVTHGAGGLELRLGSGRRRRLPALATLAVDTGGAGDWTTAGCLSKAAASGRLDIAGLEGALRFGQSLAAIACATVGARGAMRLKRDSVLKRARTTLEEGGLRRAPRLPPPAPLTEKPGSCPTCLMPLLEQLVLSTVNPVKVARGSY